MVWAILKRIALALGLPAELLDIDAQRRSIHETIAEHSLPAGHGSIRLCQSFAAPDQPYGDGSLGDLRLGPNAAASRQAVSTRRVAHG